jgi:aconitate decarboxylase
VYERPYGGFLAAFGQGSNQDPPYLVDEITNGLGAKWQTWGVRIKPYASMAGTHGSIDCISKLQREHPEQMKDLSSIVSIRLEMGEAIFHHGGWNAKRPLTATGAKMSNSYAAATQLVDREVLAAQFRDDMLQRDLVWELVNKTTCHYNKDIQTKGMQRAIITFKDKPTLTAEVIGARGVYPPLTNEEIEASPSTTALRTLTPACTRGLSLDRGLQSSKSSASLQPNVSRKGEKRSEEAGRNGLSHVLKLITLV